MVYETLFSENYYRENWEKLSKKYPDNDPDKDLATCMEVYADAGIGHDAMEKIMNIEARKVYDVHKDALKKTRNALVRILSGKASLGYTTKRQEIEKMRDLRIGFEFDCVRLADFRKKYNKNEGKNNEILRSSNRR